ncbi:MAG: hypothetical protein KUG79_00445 [Pseudomonadales bacterium]|nr:hypothetical protein [Pseudomonadales bacterium]
MNHKNVSTPKQHRSNKSISTTPNVNAFLDQITQLPAAKTKTAPKDLARLLFCMDATASRAAVWDTACHQQAQMFNATKDIAKLAIQLCFYRGYKSFHCGNWHQHTEALLEEMSAVRCRAGHTQIGKMLSHALSENKVQKIQALIFIGDAMEESLTALNKLAGQLGIINLPVFIFQEGHDPEVRKAYTNIARLSGGAYAPFDINSADQLRELLTAVAVFATGGRTALQRLGKRSGTATRLLAQQLRG